MGGTFKYYWLHFHAEGNWNLRADLLHPISFRQDSNGGGREWEVHARWTVLSDVSWGVAANFKEWVVNHGTMRFFPWDTVNHRALPPVDQRLNVARWNSNTYSIYFSARYR